jgi:hypothetical protein
MARQAWRNVFAADLRRWPKTQRLVAAPILAQLRSPLWTDGRDDEFVLVAGKVHNLRVAAKAFHSVEIPAGQCLSFWQQLGRPSARRGFVIGREIRHGCVVPVVAGGICQLSNALATAAAQAGFEWVERHGHSARIEQATDAPAMADATVFWNYVDLKIRAPMAWRIELTLTADELVLTIRGECQNAVSPNESRRSVVAVAGPQRISRGCLTCEERTCSMYQPWRISKQRCAWLLDASSPEFMRYLRERNDAAELFTPTLPSSWRRWLPARHRADVTLQTQPVIASGWTWLRRKLWLRLWAHRSGGQRQSSILDGQRWLAAFYARQLRPEHTALVIGQALLPHLQRAGVLGGRRYEVLASSLPMEDIQRRLDHALTHGQRRGTDTQTLGDFRADPLLLDAEQNAMRGARRIVTAHAGVAAYWRERGMPVHLLPWELPDIAPRERTSNDVPVVVLPSSALARKGAYELAEALRGWPCRLLVLGSRASDATLWQGIQVDHVPYVGDWPLHADVVVLPAHVEHSPRAALRALACGIPVVASPACGLQAMPSVTVVPAGDAAALRSALQNVLWPTRSPMSAATASPQA